MRLVIFLLALSFIPLEAYSLDLSCRTKHAMNFGWHFRTQKYNVFANENVYPPETFTIKNVKINDPKKSDAIYVGNTNKNRKLKHFKSGPDHTVYIEEHGPYSLETWTYHTNRKRLHKLEGAPRQDTMIYTATGHTLGGPKSLTFLFICTPKK